MNSEYATVPKNMRNIKEEWHDIPIPYIFLVVVVVLSSLISIIIIFFSDQKLIPLVLLFFIWYVFINYLRTPTFMTRSSLKFKFTIRQLRGKNVYAKFDKRFSKINNLKEIFKIKEVHENGLVEFYGDSKNKGSKWGMLIITEPPKVSDDELKGHIHKTTYIANSLYGDLLIKEFAFSRSTNSHRNLERTLIDSMNTDKKTPKQKEHLYQLYKHSTNNIDPTVQWSFLYFIGLGTHENIKLAESSRKKHFSGLKTSLVKSGIHIILIENRNQLINLYNQCITQKVY